MNRRHLGLALAAVTATLTLAACSTSSTGGTGTTAPASAPTTKAAAAPKATSPLSGKWHGHYSGAYHGTFTLHWVQSGSHLRGKISVSQLGSNIPLNGTVHGNRITFGTVGSTKITYTGTVSGSSMSGTYQVNGAGGGPWSASKG